MALKGITSGTKLAGQVIPYPAGTLVRDSFILFTITAEQVVKAYNWIDVAPTNGSLEKCFVGWCYHRIEAASEIAAGIPFIGAADGSDCSYVLYHFDKLPLAGVMRPAGSSYQNFSVGTATKPSSIAVTTANIGGGYDLAIYGMAAAQNLATGQIGINTWPAMIGAANRQSWQDPRGWVVGAGADPTSRTATLAGSFAFNTPIIAAAFGCIAIRFESGFVAGKPMSKINISLGDEEYRWVKGLYINEAKAWRSVKKAYIKKNNVWEMVYDLSQAKIVRVVSLGQTLSNPNNNTNNMTHSATLPTPLDPANKRYIIGIAAFNQGQWSAAGSMQINYTGMGGSKVSVQAASGHSCCLEVAWHLIPSNTTRTATITINGITIYAGMIGGIYIETAPAGLILPPTKIVSGNGFTNGQSAAHWLGDWGAGSLGTGIGILAAASTSSAMFSNMMPDNIDEMCRRNWASRSYDIRSVVWATHSSEVNEVRYPSLDLGAAGVGRGGSVAIPLLFKLA